MEVMFDASASSDSNGSIVSYEWTFGDGATAAGSQVMYTYSLEGNYAVTLVVTDNDGLTASASTTVHVLAMFASGWMFTVRNATLPDVDAIDRPVSPTFTVHNQAPPDVAAGGPLVGPSFTVRNRTPPDVSAGNAPVAPIFSVRNQTVPDIDADGRAIGPIFTVDNQSG